MATPVIVKRKNANNAAATVDLRSLTYEAYNLPIYDPATGLLTVGTATLDVGLGHSTADFGTGPDSGSGTDVTILAPPCFAATSATAAAALASSCADSKRMAVSTAASPDTQPNAIRPATIPRVRP